MLWLVLNGHHVLIDPGSTSALASFGMRLPGPVISLLHHAVKICRGKFSQNPPSPSRILFLRILADGFECLILFRRSALLLGLLRFLLFLFVIR